MGELDLRVLVAGRGEEDQGEAALLIVHPADLAEAEHLEEADRRVGIGDPDHGVEIFHLRLPVLAGRTPPPSRLAIGAAGMKIKKWRRHSGEMAFA